MFKCSFDEFVGEKVFSPSYSSAILGPPPRSAFFIAQLSHPYMTTEKTIALTRQTFVGKVMYSNIQLANLLFGPKT